jgi:phosphoglycolate phosphatase-like HAD superfamily hydrolase
MTDYAIAEAALQGAGHPADEATVQRFLRIHERQLPDYLHRRQGHVLPGVREALEYLSDRDDVVSLLLTGNTEGGAAAKLAHYGLTEFFPDGGAFCVGPGERVEIARRAARLAGDGRSFVIGDTPADIDCGRAIGSQTIAVATGVYSAEELARHEPWLVVAQLPAPEELAAAIGIAPS